MNKVNSLLYGYALAVLTFCSCASWHTSEAKRSVDGTASNSPSSLDQVLVAPSRRRLNDLKFASNLTLEQVQTVWGKPDGHRGFGVPYIEYNLDNGREVWLHFALDPPHTLRGALLVNLRNNLFERLY
jgi:hypothetical protein